MATRPAATSPYAVAQQWGWLSANDIRRMENMPPIDEGGDVYLQPLNMSPAGMFGDRRRHGRLTR